MPLCYVVPALLIQAYISLRLIDCSLRSNYTEGVIGSLSKAKDNEL